MSTESPSGAPYALVKIDIVSSYVTPRTLSWHNLTVSNEATKTTKDERIEPAHKFVLDDVSGEALPGELLAVVGSSRSVTSTLLTAIASKTPRAAMTGVVRVNQQPAHVMAADVLGFVPREAPLSPLLSVHDHLTLHAQLRLGNELTNDDRSARVTEVLAETGLTDAARTLIGDGTGSSDSLSARDRTLLLLATELLTRPSIILLDEPTLGLDAFDADALVRRLQALSRAGYTVVISATFDQPTSAMFTLFDKLLLLADDTYGEQVCGRTVFHGKPLDALAFVQSAGLPCPPLTNPFEFFLHQLSSPHDPETSPRVHTLVSAWAPSKPDHGGAAAPLPMVDTPLLDADGQLVEPQGNSVATQLRVLLRRNLLRISHDASSIRTRMVFMLAVATFFGIIFLRLDMSQLHVQSFGSATFFMTAVLFSSNATAEFGRTSLEAAIALRDHSQEFYHVLSWYTVWNLTELPFQLLYATVLIVPAYFLIGFPADATVFFEFYLFACLIASTGVALGYCASCAMPRKSLVVAMGMGMILLSTVFGGPFMNRKTTPVYFLWVQQISPVKYAYHGMLRAFWTHIDSIPCPAGAVCRVTTGRAVLAMNVVRPDKFASDWHILLVLNLSLRVLGGLGLWRRASRK